MLALIAEDTGQPVARIFEDSLHDRWYTADQARDFGFIDAVVDHFDDIVPPDRDLAGFASGPSGAAR